ncbi:hypothetical protein [Nocardia rosealba]|uniref:hypothetical protein n=1 Tax=Nocardia rosealba TaxID=2878563 RepID=UPI001CD939E5|nr:hypothetical protein [Nocardia rosealba]MCA2209281.1 hypothetical protein [Nocardia rosealba]
MTTAERIGVPGVRTLIDSIQTMLGNPNEASATTTAWQTAVQELTSAVDGSGTNNIGLLTAKDELGARWNGTAREAAVAYVDRIVTTTNSIRDAIKSMATQIDELRTVIMTNYKEAIALITEYAQNVVETAGGMMAFADDLLKFDPTGVIDSLTDCLSKFVELAGKKVQLVIEFRDSVMTIIQGIKNNAVTIPVQSAIAPAALDNAGWQPRHPVGKPVGNG